MVKLKNIVIDENTAKCDIYPEDSKEKGTVEVNLKTADLISYTLPAGYEYCKNHITHAKHYLLEVSESKDIPQSKIIAWY